MVGWPWLCCNTMADVWASASLNHSCIDHLFLWISCSYIWHVFSLFPTPPFLFLLLTFRRSDFHMALDSSVVHSNNLLYIWTDKFDLEERFDVWISFDTQLDLRLNGCNSNIIDVNFIRLDWMKQFQVNSLALNVILSGCYLKFIYQIFFQIKYTFQKQIYQSKSKISFNVDEIIRGREKNTFEDLISTPKFSYFTGNFELRSSFVRLIGCIGEFMFGLSGAVVQSNIFF